MSTYTQRLKIHAVPGGKRSESLGAHGEALKVRLAAPPVDGKANAELIAWAAKTFGLRLNQVALTSGQTSRSKGLTLHWPSQDALDAGLRLYQIMLTESAP